MSETAHRPAPRPPQRAVQQQQQPSGRSDGANLADILERVLDKGIVIAGDIQVNLLDIELLTIKIRLVVASVDRAKEMGIDWWERDPTLSAGRRELEDENRELRARLDALERDGHRPAVEPEPEEVEPAVEDVEDAAEPDEFEDAAELDEFETDAEPDEPEPDEPEDVSRDDAEPDERPEPDRPVRRPRRSGRPARDGPARDGDDRGRDDRDAGGRAPPARRRAGTRRPAASKRER